jgi:hypothetical protein
MSLGCEFQGRSIAADVMAVIGRPCFMTGVPAKPAVR